MRFLYRRFLITFIGIAFLYLVSCLYTCYDFIQPFRNDDSIILQVLEPICEAKFNKHSYGFRPNRNTQHAKARFETLINRACLYHFVDVDIKGFFDNADHVKLKQMWSLGISDKALLSIISRLLKVEIIGEGFLTKGTPKGAFYHPFYLTLY